MPEIRQPTAGQEPQPGWRVRHYEILSEIGRGGMGILFRARDRLLSREVALKCPLPGLVGDRKQRQRFLREARAAANLNHPNVVSIIDAFEENGIPWIVEELIEGQSLRALLLTSGRLEPETAISLAEGIAAALEEAHRKHVLHRDVKPANVLVTADQRVCLSDFGLARVLRSAQVEPDAPTEPTSLTSRGAIVGTPHYMSPEQALGREVDERSDLFALGAILYEMLTGSHPFPGAEFGEILDRIIHREPEPISRFSYEVPPELERIVRKAMSKRPDERYQTAKEFLVDLRVLRKRMELGQYGGELPEEAAPSGTQRVVNRLLRRHPALAVGGIALFLAAVGFALAVIVKGYHLFPGRAVAPSFGSPIQVTVSPAWEREPAVSPDGSRVAYVSDGSGNADIWVSNARGGPSLQLTHDPAADTEPAWDADGSHLYFSSDRGGARAIWKIPQFGSDPILVVRDALSPAISPDGSRIAFIRALARGETRVVVAPLARPEDATVLTGDEDGLWRHLDPAWSPDGKSVCYGSQGNLWLAPVDGSRPRPLTRDGTLDRHPAWSPDGNSIYFSSYREGTLAVWRVTLADGRIERMTLGTGEEDSPSLSRDGSRLAYATREASHDIVVRNVRTGRESVLSGLRYGLMPAFSPDGTQLVFASDRWGANLDLWVQDLNEGIPVGTSRRLTDGPGDFSHPTVSPDGRWVAVYRILGETRKIWLVPLSGGPMTQITEGTSSDLQPAWSPDGSRLAFSSDRGGTSAIWSVPITDGKRGGEPTLVAAIDGIASAPSWSPDGRYIAFQAGFFGQNEAWVVDMSDRSVRPLTEGADVIRIRWDPDSKAVLASGFWGTDHPTLRRVSLKGGAGVPIEPPVAFGEDSIEGFFDVTPDGELLSWCRVEYLGDIWTLSAR